MIPRISLLLLMANCAVVMAQPLYKWVETDGSITFSPDPPAGGIPYERLDSTSTPRAATAAEQAASSAGTSAAADLPAQSPVSPMAPLPRVQYAPGDSADLPPAISRATPVPSGTGSDATLRPMSSALAVSQTRNESDQMESPDNLAASISAANFKQSRCQDLQKRVTSLERRLKSRLTPEDMDNTVLHMARYQRSFDQYCAQ